MFYPSPESCQIAGLAELYEEYFERFSDGVFVDVGANDGYSWSNTWGLGEAGWLGVCYEPVPNYANACILNNATAGHRVVTVKSCVGSFNGRVKLFIGGVDSTIDEETADKSPHGFVYDKNDFIICDCVTLDSDLHNHGVRQGFELISIDVEGAELQVLAGFNLFFWKPKMIIIETHVGISGKDYHAHQIIDEIQKFGYERINLDELNTIFWHPSYKKAGN